MDTAIEVRQLRKTYGQTVAVNGVSFEVRQGEIFGMVGPNGAGKTTTVECIEGLRQPSDGAIRVLGVDPHRDGPELRERIGVQLQEANLPDRLKVWEAMDLFTGFYRRAVNWRPLLEQMGLAEKQNAPIAKLSGGQKQRLFIALALVNDPELIFMDELTTGLDPQARRAMWELVRGIRERGKTVFLTTHFMEEAERLCDRVAILDGGRLIALDTPRNLIHNLGAGNRVVFEINGNFAPAALEPALPDARIERNGDRVSVTAQSERLASAVVHALETNNIHFQNLRTEQPSLEDVFLSLTGRAMRD
ncbi:MAG TPA: ABC transporter ATP-binding protein [Anaerolineales bacterium]|nr:ABC transporter ATP-binding protein [Anaerolineales bacterium]